MSTANQPQNPATQVVAETISKPNAVLEVKVVQIPAAVKRGITAGLSRGKPGPRQK